MFIFIKCSFCHFQSDRIEVNTADELEEVLRSYFFCPDCASADLSIHTE